MAMWSPNHTKEVEFAARKADDRRLQAQQEGVLLPSEKSQTEAGAGADRLQTILSGVRKRRNAELRHADLRSGGGVRDDLLASIKGLPAFNATGVDLPMVSLAWLPDHVTPSHTEARVFLLTTSGGLHNFKNPYLWSAILTGAFVLALPPNFGSAEGDPKNSVAIVKYRAAISRPIALYITKSFRTSHPDHFKVICSCARATGSAWRLLPNRVAFTKSRQSRRKTVVIALVTGGDLQSRQDQTMANLIQVI